MNYMDYVDDKAMFMFTAGQATRMNAALNGPRRELFEALPRYPGVLGPGPRRKPAVKKVQEVLRDRFDHPDLVADGVYAERTERIVRTFQRRRHGPPWNLPRRRQGRQAHLGRAVRLTQRRMRTVRRAVVDRPSP